ncbi:alpha/beta fold hydrolase [Gracilimonas sp. Q87]|uniref:alpha/beta fold hydrolase n=1 Tax=Gracilimonas sp. Q87 TaxID=3384766 RepID=UPI003983E83A
MMWTALKILGYILLAYVVIVLIVSLFQRQLIYFPARDSEEKLIKSAQSKNLEPWRNSEGELMGWKSPAPKPNAETNAVLVFHGNAGYALHRDYIADGLLSQETGSPWQLYLFEYPGYGSRPGSPSEQNIKESGARAFSDLVDLDHQNIFVFGESIGNGVACYLSQKYPEKVDGMLLVSAFTSMADMVREHYWYLPIRLLLRENYENIEMLEGYTGPVAFLYGEQDRIVPPRLTKELFESYQGPKKIYSQPNSGHNTMNYDSEADWWELALTFLTKQ